MCKVLVGSMLRTLAGVGVVCVLAFGVGAAHGAGASSEHHCGKSGFCGARAQASGPSKRNLCVRYWCRTVAADTVAEILFVTFRRKERFAPTVGTYARWRATGHLSLLVAGGAGSLETLYKYGPNGYSLTEGEPMALAGRYVAFALFACVNVDSPGCGGGATVVRVDIKSSRRVKLGGGNTITDIVLTTKGTAAWIENKNHPAAPEVRIARTPPPRFAVETKLLASSPTIDPRSLALAGGHLYWTEGGQPRVAQIE